MKKIIFLIVFFLISNQLVVAKEIRTRFGFYINLPSNYIQLNANIDELLKKDSEGLVNKEYFDELVSGSTKTDMNIEYLFPNKKYDPEFNNMNITSVQGDIKELMTLSMNEICPEIRNMMAGLYNKRIKQYQCLDNPSFIKKKSSPIVYYFELDGPFNNQRAHLIMLQIIMQ